jgi:hypothetical protein
VRCSKNKHAIANAEKLIALFKKCDEEVRGLQLAESSEAKASQSASAPGAAAASAETSNDTMLKEEEHQAVALSKSYDALQLIVPLVRTKQAEELQFGQSQLELQQKSNADKVETQLKLNAAKKDSDAEAFESNQKISAAEIEAHRKLNEDKAEFEERALKRAANANELQRQERNERLEYEERLSKLEHDRRMKSDGDYGQTQLELEAKLQRQSTERAKAEHERRMMEDPEYHLKHFEMSQRVAAAELERERLAKANEAEAKAAVAEVKAAEAKKQMIAERSAKAAATRKRKADAADMAKAEDERERKRAVIKKLEAAYKEAPNAFTRGELDEALRVRIPDAEERSAYVLSLCSSDAQAGVYALLLEGEPWSIYVGSSLDIAARVNNHTHHNGGAECTRLATSIKRVPMMTTGNVKDLDTWERAETLSRMYAIGIDNVRGWDYVQRVMTPEKRKVLL